MLMVPVDKNVSALALLAFWAGWLFIVGCCPGYCRMLRSISGLYFTGCQEYYHLLSWVLPDVPWGAESPSVGNHCGKWGCHFRDAVFSWASENKTGTAVDLQVFVAFCLYFQEEQMDSVVSFIIQPMRLMYYIGKWINPLTKLSVKESLITLAFCLFCHRHNRP